jgi:hypothetical protein
MKKSHHIILTILIIFFPVLFIFQGLDLTDTGFHLARITNFLEQNTGGNVWFSYFIGYLWEQVFGQIGLVGFKFLSYLFYELTIWTVFFGFRKIFPRKYLLFYVFLCMMMTLSIKTFFYSYDNVTNLFLILGATLMLVGVTSGSRIKILLAGFIFALSAFSRLPNIVTLALMALFPFYEFIKRYRLRDAWENRLVWLRSSGFYMLGFGLGVSLVLLIMHLFGQLDRVLGIMGETLSGLANNSGDAGHSATGMLSKQFDSGKRMFNSALLFMLMILLLSWIIQNKSRGKRTLYFSLAVVGTAVFIFLRTDHEYFINYVNIITGSQIILALLFYLRIFKIGIKYRFALLLGVGVMVISFMGSDTGLLKSAAGWFMTIPVLFMIFDEIGDFNLVRDNQDPPQALAISPARIKNFLVFVIILTSLMIRYVAIFGDEGSRLRMLHAVDIPLARATCTTKEKARQVEVIYNDLKRHLKEDDCLIGHGGGPLFIYLTDARLFMNATWLMWYETSRILPDLQAAYEKDKKLPVILIVNDEIFRTLSLEEKDEMMRQHEEIYKFITSFDYQRVVKAENHEIWVPQIRGYLSLFSARSTMDE